LGCSGTAWGRTWGAVRGWGGLCIPAGGVTATLNPSTCVSGWGGSFPECCRAPALRGPTAQRAGGLCGVQWIPTVWGVRNAMGGCVGAFPVEGRRGAAPPSPPLDPSPAPFRGWALPSASEPPSKSPRRGDEGQSAAPPMAFCGAVGSAGGSCAPQPHRHVPLRCPGPSGWLPAAGRRQDGGWSTLRALFWGGRVGSSSGTGLGEPKPAPGFATLRWRDLGR